MINNSFLLGQEPTEITETDEIEAQIADNITVEDIQLSDYEKSLRNFKYFNLGFKGDELAANFSSCGDRAAYWYYLELETYTIKLSYGNGEQNTFNSTLFTQNTTDVLHICTDVTENIYYFILWKQEQFPSWSDFGLGFLQNLLANVLRMNYINDKLTALREETELTGVDNSDKEWYYIGVIVRLLIVFDPITDELTRT